MLHGAEHIRRYEETDGKEGHIWLNGAPTLILTTAAARAARKTARLNQTGRPGSGSTSCSSLKIRRTSGGQFASTWGDAVTEWS